MGNMKKKCNFLGGFPLFKLAAVCVTVCIPPVIALSLSFLMLLTAGAKVCY